MNEYKKIIKPGFSFGLSDFYGIIEKYIYEYYFLNALDEINEKYVVDDASIDKLYLTPRVILGYINNCDLIENFSNLNNRICLNYNDDNGIFLYRNYLNEFFNYKLSNFNKFGNKLCYDDKLKTLNSKDKKEMEIIFIKDSLQFAFDNNVAISPFIIIKERDKKNNFSYSLINNHWESKIEIYFIGLLLENSVFDSVEYYLFKV